MLYVTNVPDDMPYRTRYTNRKGIVLVGHAKPETPHKWTIQLGIEQDGGVVQWLPEWTHSAQDRDEAFYKVNALLAYYDEGKESPFKQQAQAV